MNQEQLISKTVENTELPKSTVIRCFNGIFGSIADALGSGENVTIRRFGGFRVVEHQERNGVNPRTQESIVTPACKHVKFTAGSDLLSKVRG